jgi:hypothetical protein
MDRIDLGRTPNNPGKLNPGILWTPVFNGQVVPRLLKSIAIGCLVSLLAPTHLLAQNNPPHSSSQATQNVPTTDQPSGPTTRRNTVRALMASRQAPANSQEPASK